MHAARLARSAAAPVGARRCGSPGDGTPYARHRGRRFNGRLGGDAPETRRSPQRPCAPCGVAERTGSSSSSSPPAARGQQQQQQPPGSSSSPPPAASGRARKHGECARRVRACQHEVTVPPGHFTESPIAPHRCLAAQHRPMGKPSEIPNAGIKEAWSPRRWAFLVLQGMATAVYGGVKPDTSARASRAASKYRMLLRNVWTDCVHEVKPASGCRGFVQSQAQAVLQAS
ncbi:unnamed protein product [Lampetra planeri]